MGRERRRLVVAPSSSLLLALSLLALTLMPAAVLGFKEAEFKKCKDAAFCSRHRDRQPGDSSYALQEGRLTQSGTALVGTIINTAVADRRFLITLTAYKGGIVRIKLTEDGNARFEVPDVIEPDFESSQQVAFDSVTQPSEGKTVLKLGAHEVTVAHSPFAVYASTNGVDTIEFNSRGLFDIEHKRDPTEGDAPGLFAETFRSHSDSKKKGPQAIAMDVSFPGSRHVYGIPERAKAMALPPTKGEGVSSEPYRMYNLDVFEYLADSPFGLYGSIPMMVAHDQTTTRGVFWLNSAEMWVDVMNSDQGTDTLWIAESGVLDLFFMLGPTPSEVFAQYGRLTGTTSMPQYFSIAYHQCRWNYRDEADVNATDAGFDEHNLPYDVLWLDIEHTDGKKYMTWDSRAFPKPVEMQQRIAGKTRKMVTIIDPHIKRDSNFMLHSEASSKGYYVKDANGNEYDGWCWPGSSSYLDVLNPAIRSWWADKFSLSSYKGSTEHLYIWNDMNEPSVFNGPEITMPKDALHYGDVEHRDVHNLYGYLYHAATAEGLLRRGKGQDRPFVLSRAFYAGTQKVGPIWTGDNEASWDHLKVSIPMLLTLGLTGLPNSGADIGGFFGNPEPELLVRWYQLGAYYPFFRGHAHLDTRRREPWLFGEENTALIREALRTRYALLPHLYTLFHQTSVDGSPIMRPLWVEYPADTSTYAMQEEFLLGKDLLIRPVLDAGATSVEVYLPGQQPWYDIVSGRKISPGRISVPVTMSSTPAYQRGGSIIPRQERPRRRQAVYNICISHSKAMEKDPYTLFVALDNTASAEGEIYIDDGRSYAFRDGAFVQRKFSYRNNALSSIDVSEGRSNGKFTVANEVERIVIFGLRNPPPKSAMVESSGFKREVKLASGRDLPNTPAEVVVIRKPGVQVAGDWVISLQ
eukprot:jgi/Chlat1/5487/Chrsp36S05435